MSDRKSPLLPLLLFVCSFICAGAHADTTTTIVLRGQPVPGFTGSYFSSFNPPAVNLSGQTAFIAGVSGTPTGATGNSGIWHAYPSGDISLVALGSFPLAWGRAQSIKEPAINNAGQIAFWSGIDASSNLPHFGVFLNDYGYPYPVGRELDAFVGGNGQKLAYSYGTATALSDSGMVAFSSAVNGDGITTSNAGLFTGVEWQTPQGFALQLKPYLGGTQTYNTFSAPLITPKNQVVFYATLNGGGPTTPSHGIFIRGADPNNGGPAWAGALQFESFVGGTQKFQQLGEPDFNAVHELFDLVFRSTLDGNGTTTPNDGVFIRNFRHGPFPPPVFPIALQGQTQPAGPEHFVSFGDPVISSTSQIAFKARLDGKANVTPTDGIFTSSPDGQVKAVALNNSPAPDGVGRIIGLYSMAIKGWTTLVTAGMSNDYYGIPDGAAAILGDGTEQLQIARTGQPLAGSTISGITIINGRDVGGRSSLNEMGQVAYQATLADGRSGIFLYTPTIHYRSTTSGNWDDHSNWTVSIPPAYAHDVILDPPGQTTITGPSAAVTVGSLRVGASAGGLAKLSMIAGGSISVVNATNVDPAGQLDVSSGTFTAQNIENNGTLTSATGGTLNALNIYNHKTADLAGTLHVSNAISNDGSMTLRDGATIFSQYISNSNTLVIDNATTTGAIVTNDFGALLRARGYISGTLTNKGQLNLTGLFRVFSSTTNLGAINIGPGQNLAASVTNFGAINLTGGYMSYEPVFNNALIQGGGAISGNVVNQGLIFANQPGIPFVITGILTNSSTGRVEIASGSLLNLLPDNPSVTTITNSGIITLDAAGAILSGMKVTNPGTIKGAGQINNTLLNTGILRAEGGELAINGTGNTNSGQIQIPASATITYTQGLATNSGTIALSGGAFDNNNLPLANTGSILGNGTFRSSELTNATTGQIHFADSPSNVFGAVINDGLLKITSNTATFYGPVVNNSGGTIKITTATARFLSTFTSSGAYISDPADNFFQDLQVGASGYLVGGQGDRFFISGDLISQSNMNENWDTTNALLEFTGRGPHHLQSSAIDRGICWDGFDHNFAWGELHLRSGEKLIFDDPLYVTNMVLDDGLAQLALLSTATPDVNIYYSLNGPANTYLNGQTYTLSGGGHLVPVPEPACAAISLVMFGFILPRRRPQTPSTSPPDAPN